VLYLSKSELRGCAPPIDRQCRICRKIGHFAKSCPTVGKGRNAEEEDSSSSSDKSQSSLPPTSSETSPDKNVVPQEQTQSKSQPTDLVVEKHQSAIQVQLGNGIPVSATLATNGNDIHAPNAGVDHQQCEPTNKTGMCFHEPSTSTPGSWIYEEIWGQSSTSRPVVVGGVSNPSQVNNQPHAAQEMVPMMTSHQPPAITTNHHPAHAGYDPHRNPHFDQGNGQNRQQHLSMDHSVNRSFSTVKRIVTGKSRLNWKSPSYSISRIANN
jgi:hypothetical protein